MSPQICEFISQIYGLDETENLYVMSVYDVGAGSLTVTGDLTGCTFASSISKFFTYD